MTDVVVGRVEEFPPGTHRVVVAEGREIGVFNIGGRFYGLPNRCPHQAGPLCAGRRVTGTVVADGSTGWRPEWSLEDEVIACPWHGLEYHVPTGQCLAYPEIVLRHYPVQVRDGEVVVSLSRTSSRRRPAASDP